MNFTINLTFSHPSGYQLGILGTEIKNEYFIEKSLPFHFSISRSENAGEEDKGNGYILSALKNIFRPLIRIDRRPPSGKKGHFSLKVLQKSILQGGRDIVPFLNNRFLRHF